MLHQAQLPSDHWLVLQCKHTLADTLAALGDYDNAIELHESILVLRHRMHGKYHPSVVLSSLALGDTLRLSLRRHLYSAIRFPPPMDNAVRSIALLKHFEQQQQVTIVTILASIVTYATIFRYAYRAPLIHLYSYATTTTITTTTTTTTTTATRPAV